MQYFPLSYPIECIGIWLKSQVLGFEPKGNTGNISNEDLVNYREAIIENLIHDPEFWNRVAYRFNNDYKKNQTEILDAQRMEFYIYREAMKGFATFAIETEIRKAASKQLPHLGEIDPGVVSNRNFRIPGMAFSWQKVDPADLHSEHHQELVGTLESSLIAGTVSIYGSKEMVEILYAIDEKMFSIAVDDTISEIVNCPQGFSHEATIEAMLDMRLHDPVEFTKL